MVTRRKSEELARRTSPESPTIGMVDDLLRVVLEEIEASVRVRFPSPKYRLAPVAFAREILGVEPWSRQIDILEAVRDNPRVAVASGHKVSKSHSIAILALWFYCSFPDARVVMTSSTARQVDQILWRELRMMRSRSGRCVACKAADPSGRLIPAPCIHSSTIDFTTEGELARTGLKSHDFREIVGFTAREAEAVAGISGRNLLYLPDEASGIPDVIFEAIEGNRAGGARIAMFGNPTRNEGEFFEAFHEKSRLYKTLTISSEETPNVISGEMLIPGLATREWIEEKKEEWGVDSAMYSIRVKGKFARNEVGKIFSVHLIAESERRWHDTEAIGRLFVGVDPSGPTGAGDDTVFCARRGKKMLKLEVLRGFDEQGLLARVLQFLTPLRVDREVPVVVIDREGEIGSRLHAAMGRHAERYPRDFQLVSVRASDGASRQPMIYGRMRDELAANAEAWIREGGAILEDAKLEKELHAFSWKQNVSAKLKLTPKDDVRKAIGRSPDRYDAFVLSIWEPLSVRDGGAEVADRIERFNARERTQDHHAGGGAFDPYSGSDAFRGR